MLVSHCLAACNKNGMQIHLTCLLHDSIFSGSSLGSSYWGTSISIPAFLAKALTSPRDFRSSKGVKTLLTAAPHLVPAKAEQDEQEEKEAVRGREGAGGDGGGELLVKVRTPNVCLRNICPSSIGYLPPENRIKETINVQKQT